MIHKVGCGIKHYRHRLCDVELVDRLNFIHVVISDAKYNFNNNHTNIENRMLNSKLICKTKIIQYKTKPNIKQNCKEESEDQK